MRRSIQFLVLALAALGLAIVPGCSLICPFETRVAPCVDNDPDFHGCFGSLEDEWHFVIEQPACNQVTGHGIGVFITGMGWTMTGSINARGNATLAVTFDDGRTPIVALASIDYTESALTVSYFDPDTGAAAREDLRACRE